MNRKSIINRFVDRPHVYLTKYTYSNCVDFLSGFMIASNISDEFSDFVKSEFDTNFSVHWSYFILDEISNSNEIDALDILLSLMKKYSKFITG